MLNWVRAKVSKKKKRYQQDGFDLDLSYIGDRIIAMGYPAFGFESLYRNDFSQVKAFLDKRHGTKYWVYNLCSERSYDASVFDGRVERFPFDDHTPPPFDMIRQFCIAAARWLAEDPENIAVVHCKAGKGRTGVMICALMLHIQMKPTALEALSFYGSTRTFDSKGVTIPSQRHYVFYYEKFLRMHLPLEQPFADQPVIITRLEINAMPSKFYKNDLEVKFASLDGKFKQKANTRPHLHHRNSRVSFNLRDPPTLLGDFKIAVCKAGGKAIFYMWHNSSLVEPDETFSKDIIDKAAKSKKYTDEFTFRIYSQRP